MRAPVLYDVRIGHLRATPVRRSFEHRSHLWLVDLDDVAAGELGLPRWLAGQARFEAADHVGDPDRSIKQNVVAFAAEHGVDDVARVLMLAHPRAGAGRASHVFNPLSTHWCYRADGSPACVVAEVHNTYGERHAYLLHPDEAGRAEVDKEFYVSPFLTVAGRYRMSVASPGERVRVAVELHQDGERVFSAWVSGTGRPATAARVAALALRRPLPALKGSALIRWHGLRLWARRLPITPRQTGNRVATSSPAARLAALVTEVLGDLPLRIRAWDGSEAGPAGAPTVVIRDRRALRRLLWDPDELGLARAYVAGELDVDGDLADGLSRVWALVRARPPRLPGWRDRLRWARAALRLGVVGPRPAPPEAEAVLAGEKHTTHRDSDAIKYHYDQSNDLYAALLDEHMAYSCAYFRQDPALEDGDYDITDAQRDKLELVCRKLGLQPGMRLLDVGCGWGSLILYAAEHHGVHATGVTISAQQRDHVEKLVAERGLADRVTVRLQDYRDVPVPVEGRYDAVASIEMSEHVGQEQYRVYAATLHRLVRPGGRVLVQAMSHPSAPGGGAFIERYVAPDMHMRPTWDTVAMLSAPGLELRDVESLREHYDWTVSAWARRLEERWDEIVGLVGVAGARIWRLYLAGGGLTFREGRMGVDQVLLVRPTDDGGSGMPPTRAGWAL
ncbi:DUF1365 family protein [Petropleomorpha daqingensis]|uniref:Cyclopropane fatty-acyl-phospholipid synthase-like methyltransferase/DUF1365 family protein n=1 Tax=Petropleomorpha daqingensis TaxID=2026353 RepID=A0A853CJV5_9ACTN|nr:cyclopropane fatty-acyl-phospholipid synthase-like methyltransferase/DUF1365 family protein [Petropleomorpha daqingensis]